MASTGEDPKRYGLNEPIAIVGTGCRFAGQADSPSKLWDLLQAPPDLQSKIPSDRFSAEGFFNANNAYHGSSNVRHSYFLSENIRLFDAQFFGIKPVEANAIDPQQRLLLEVVYEALERGGHALGDLRGSDTAVYVGVMCGDYEAMLLRDTDTMPTYHATGIARSILSNRISYFFDWHGPSMTIDTACSSSLLALHQAVQVLRQGNSRIAVAAGTNLILGPENYIGESKLKMLSPNGRSRMWDADADGYARGEGVAAVVLKRLSDALRDGDVIEAIVRETGTNQDGRTRGITMPSASAQTSLIRQVYRAAGLDPVTRPEDRPQFFEAHGTGTPAGDPIEAEAIRDAFFPSTDDGATEAAAGVLHVGSIKTVMGHTEGTAGLAAVIKASLAVQHGLIPPNLLFNSLNPKIEPFYHHLNVPTSAIPWPQLPSGQPRRASVNSFGFGGANAHAIIESFSLPSDETAIPGRYNSQEKASVVPFVFSANSQQALKAHLRDFAAFLSQNKATINLSELASMLQTRRSRLPVATSFSASDINGLIEQIERASNSPNSTNIGTVLHSSSSTDKKKPRILGIFTGQGAQWAGMGRNLLLTSPFANSRLRHLDAQLQSLPPNDRPAWSLLDILLATADIGQADLSQPLCTAVQILLVDLARAAGISFTAVVGHSSGEIAAAYAAGMVTAEDACRIAYYRGLHASKACGTTGQQGRMMAVATSRDDAKELCELPHFNGRICVAANNGPLSVTLSGDEDAVLEAKVVFEDENKGAKVLVVDKAYHSHHMQASAEAYEEDLVQLAPKFDLAQQRDALAGGTKTRWFSSVYDRDVTEIPEKMDGRYWNANMVGSVLFADALETAWRESGPFDAIVEVGPHPALKRPALDTIKSVATSQASSPAVSSAPPYTGLLSRGQDDVLAFSQALGSLWTVLPGGKDSVLDIATYEDTLLGVTQDGNTISTPRKAPALDLPSYPWDHEREFWHESRASRGFRTRTSPTHVLLGNLQVDGLQDKQLQWRNLLSVREVPWLDGHKLQGQTVFPAAGYCAMALEAGQILLETGIGAEAEVRSAKTMELSDVIIHNALVFQDDDTPVETVFTVSEIHTDLQQGVLAASWSLDASNSATNESALQTTWHMAPKASGTLRIVLGTIDEQALPPRGADEPLMIDVDRERFYTSLADVGYGYTGRFKALDNLSRKAGYASGTIAHDADSCRDGLVVHPSSLDTAIQAVILAFCYPYDGELSAIRVPTKIRSLRINPTLCNKYFATVPEDAGQVLFPFDAVLGTEGTGNLLGDVDVFAPSSSSSSTPAMFQLEGVQCVLFAPATPADDRLIFSTTSWGPLEPDCPAISTDMRATPEQHSLALDLERACLYYLQKWEREVPADSPVRSPGHEQYGLFRYSAHIRSLVASGRHAYARREWLDDGPEVLEDILSRHGGADAKSCLDLKVVTTVGDKIPDVVAGKTTILEHLFQDDLLTQYYSDALGFPPYTTYLARTMGQLSHRYPSMDVLEVGAGTGHATRKIFGEIGSAFGSYTFTDLSAGFLDKAQAKFAESPATAGVVDKMSFRVLDIEKDVTSQGYTPHSFDVVVASFVLHATPDLEVTLRNVHRLLKPGGYLMLLEMTDNKPMRSGFIFGTLPGWWAGENDGRVYSPCIEVEKWDDVLRSVGFSGAESVAHNAEDQLPFPAAVIVSQALDDRVRLLREPLDELPMLGSGGLATDKVGDELLIIGGATATTARVVPRLRRYLEPYFTSLAIKLSFGEIIEDQVTPTTTILNLSDLDKPIFQDLTEQGWSGLKTACEHARTIVWFTAGAGNGASPYASMSIGFGRSVLWEVPGLQLQFIDLDLQDTTRARSLSLDATEIANAVLRFSLASEWDVKGQLSQLTWSNELELSVRRDEEGGFSSGGINAKIGVAAYSIPRVKASRAQNNRFNSSQRRITEPVDLAQAVSLSREEDGTWALDKLSQDAVKEEGEDMILVDVHFSSLSTLSIGNNSHMYAAVGKDTATGATVVGLSETQASRVLLSRSHAITLHKDVASLAGLLDDIVYGLLASAILRDAVEGDAILVHEPSTDLARHLCRKATAIGAKIKFTTTSTTAATKNDTWALCPVNVPHRELRRTIPAKTTAFVDLSSLTITNGDAQFVGQRLARQLPRHARVIDIQSSLSSVSRSPARVSDDGVIVKQLQHLVDLAAEHSGVINSVVALANLANHSLDSPADEPHILSLIDWQQAPDNELLSTLVRPVDHKPLFRRDRSYWLVGLTGDLGLSLVEWMVDSGAEHIILSSRNPNIDERWLAKMKARGDNHIHIYANDVTDLSDVQRVHDDIVANIAPLAGVAQGAMVLRDTLIRDMDIDTMHSVLRPKVQGSINLQQVLSPTGCQDDGLDFFIYFSSMTQVVGNMGQSNYTAANAFMASLAQQRRRAGLAASVINIGAIIGLGYVTREASQASQDNLLKGGYQFLSAHAFHHIFAEAVVSGRADAPREGESGDGEISTGLRHVRGTDSRLPVWFSNPRFSHHIIREEDENKDASKSKGGNGISVTAALKDATTPTQVRQIVQDAFLNKLENLLKSELASGDSSAALGLRTDEIGVDSLVAVEIRTWLLKTLQVNVPVLKILGGASLGDILDHAIAQLPKDLVPNLGGESAIAATSDAPASKPAMAAQVAASTINGDTETTIQSLASSSPRLNGTVTSTATSVADKTEQQDIPLSQGHDLLSGKLPEPAPAPTPTPTPTPAPVLPALEVVRSGPLSYSQSMFWFVHKFAQDPTTLNHTGLFRLHGRIRTANLRAAVRQVGEHHEALRTMFLESADADDSDKLHPTQSILAKPTMSFETRTIRSAAEATTAFAELSKHAYRLELGESMRLILLSSSADEHYLLLGCHHINVDGWTQQVLMRDLDLAYKSQSLPPTLQYLDYTIRQREESLNGAWTRDLEYWQHVLRPEAIPDPLPILPLPDSGRRQILTNYDFHRVKIRLDVQTMEKILKAARSARATTFQFFLAAFRCLVVRLAGTEDFAVGVGDANRRAPDTRNAIGAYINILPLVFSGNGDGGKGTFDVMLQDTRDKIMSALNHAGVPFGAILETLQVPRSEYHSPIFQAFVDYREGAEITSDFLGAKMELMSFESGRTGYDINLDICNYVGCGGGGMDGEGLEGADVELMLQASLYSADDAKTLLESYERLLVSLAGNVEEKVSEVGLYDAEEVQGALRLGRGPVIKSKWPETLCHRVIEVARERGDTTAIKDGYGGEMTYKQLLDRVVVIVETLNKSSPRPEPGQIIIVLQDRTCDWIACLLAVMYIGCTYLPLDPDAPPARLATIVDDCQPRFIITDSTTKGTAAATLDMSNFSTSTLNISDIKATTRLSAGLPPILATANSPGAILYTSGSTGTPKGIILRHSNLRNEVEFSVITYNLDTTNGERVLQQSAPGFDMSLTQIFGALAFGGFLYICPASIRADAVAITKVMVDEQITMTGGTPSEYLSWIEAGSASLTGVPWRVAISGGEAVRKSLLRGFALLDKQDLKLYNAYGPTEVTCSATRLPVDYRRLDVAEHITAGTAAPNAFVYIADSDGSPLPVGFSGEIMVGGAGIASSYLGRPDETASRFTTGNDGSIVHKTGDLGKLTASGELIVQGRIQGDTQVKLRGIRIDLHEVEQALIRGLAAQGIVDVVVSVRQSATSSKSSRDTLVAHAVFSSSSGDGAGGSPADSLLQNAVASLALPTQMKPSVIVPVSSLPRGTTGKVDRKAVAKLPLHSHHGSPSNAVVDTEVLLSEEEKSLREVWTHVIAPELLGDISRIRSTTDFFHVGGNSLLLVDLQREIKATLGTNVRLVELFEFSTLGRMATLVTPSMVDDASSTEDFDWDAETEQLLPTAPLENSERSASPCFSISSPPKVVVLTGGTGHLGRELIRQLLADPSIDRIHCIAIRPSSNIAHLTDALSNPQTSSKLQTHRGDLSLPSLGLSPSAIYDIFSTADTIIHNGANVSHLKHYQTLKSENVGSTAELIRLALPRRVPVHFISTAGVALFTGAAEFHEVSVRDTPPPGEAEGYTASKWASEVLLEKVHERLGLPVTIHRPSNIARDDVPDLDLFQNLIKYCRLTKTVPAANETSLAGYLNLVGVEECASGVLEEIRVSSDPNHVDGVRFVHQIGATNLSFDKLAEHVAAQEEQHGGNGSVITSVPLEEWVQLAETAGMHSTVASYFRRAAQGVGSVKYPLLVKE